LRCLTASSSAASCMPVAGCSLRMGEQVASMPRLGVATQGEKRSQILHVNQKLHYFSKTIYIRNRFLCLWCFHENFLPLDWL
jgi:hypothetical protein